MRKKLKTKNGKSRKLDAYKYKYKMERLDTGETEETEEEIMSEDESPDYLQNYTPSGAETIREPTFRSKVRKSQSERELQRLQYSSKNKKQFDKYIAIEETKQKFKKESPNVFLQSRQEDFETSRQQELIRRDNKARAEYIFNIIANNQLDEMRSLLESDIFINKHKSYVFINEQNPQIQNTFLTYAIRLGRIEMVRLMLAAGFPVDINMIQLTTNTELVRIIQIYSNNNLTFEQKFLLSNSSRSIEGPQTSQEIS